MTPPPTVDRFHSERRQILLARHRQPLSHRWALVVLYAATGVVATRSPNMVADAWTPQRRSSWRRARTADELLRVSAQFRTAAPSATA